MGLFDTNRVFTRPVMVSGTKTETFTATKSVSISNPKGQRFILMNVAIEGYSIGEQWDCSARTMSGAVNTNLPIIRNDGMAYISIKENGRYIIDTGGSGFTLYFSGGNAENSKNLTIAYSFVDECPIIDIKPVQKLYSIGITLSTGTDTYNPVQYLGGDISLFKYVIIAIRCRNAAENNYISQTFNVQAGWRDPYKGSTPALILFKNIGEVNQDQGFDSELIPVQGGDLSVRINVPNPTDGARYYINVYGVR